MSRKSSFPDGIVLNCEHDGLLTVAEDRLISIIKKEPISNVYHVEQTPFARGKFATVRKCTHQQTGVEYAAKFIRKRRRAMDQRQDIIHEVAVLQLATDCPFIVSLHEVFETSAEVALVLELAAGGELQTVLDVQEGLQESEAVTVMRQIIEGLGFLHDRNIAHLDLKPQNLLLTGPYPECDIKLCDFGISRVIQGGVEVREILGTPDYVAPEILSYEPISLATDIWSVGVLAYVLLSGFSPFGGDTKQETFLNISQCSLTFPSELFEGVSNTAKDFIRATLQTEPKKRLTTRQCLQHPWLNPASTLITRSITVESCQSVDRVVAEETHSLPSKENGVACAIVNVQETPCVETVRVTESVVVCNGTGKGELQSCRMVDDMTVNCSESAEVMESVPVCNGLGNVEIQSCRMGDDITAKYLKSMENIQNRMGNAEVQSCRVVDDLTVNCSESEVMESVPVCNRMGNVEIQSCRMGDDITAKYLKSMENVHVQNGTGNKELRSCRMVEDVTVNCSEVMESVPVCNGTGNIELQSCRMGDDIIDNYLQSMEVVGLKEDDSYRNCAQGYNFTEDVSIEEVKVRSNGAEKSSVGDKINGLKISTVSLECSGVSEYKERRTVVEMSQELELGPESDEDLPVHKRPKNCEDDCSFPQCCHLPLKPVESNTTAERPVLC